MPGVQVDVDVLHMEEFQQFYHDIRDSVEYLRSKKKLTVIESRIVKAVDCFEHSIEDNLL